MQSSSTTVSASTCTSKCKSKCKWFEGEGEGTSRILINSNSSLKMSGSASSPTRVSVIAVSEIPAGARTEPFDLRTALSACRTSLRHLNVTLSAAPRSGEPRISLHESSISLASFFWPKLIQFAPDCHAQNVRLCRTQVQTTKTNSNHRQSSVDTPSTVVLQAIRKIHAGEPLLLWFGEDLLIDAHIPSYLSPINIKGGSAKSYVCHKCGFAYEAPNQLKLHLALSCGRYPVDTIWARLASTSTSLGSGPTKELHRQLQASSVLQISSPSQTQLLQPLQLTVPLDFSANRTPADAVNIVRAPYFVPPLAHALSLISSIRNGHHHRSGQQDQDHEPDSTSSSTPTPPMGTTPRNSRSGENGMRSDDSERAVTEKAPRAATPDNRRQLQRLHSHHHPGFTQRDKVLAEQHAHLESLVSNMGKGKNGHVCLYCGKLYSRKYGLKIHIRTHTGYKPLACKICHRPFGDPSNLNKHVRLHSDGVGPDGGVGGRTPYRCDICGKVLVRRRDLDRHIQSRHAQLLSSAPGRRQELQAAPRQ